MIGAILLIFAEAAAAYDLDTNLLIGIATLESGFGTSEVAEATNNWFGWTRDNGEYKVFESPKVGVWYVAEKISERPHDTVEELVAWYNPGHAEFWGGWMEEYLEGVEFEIIKEQERVLEI